MASRLPRKGEWAPYPVGWGMQLWAGQSPSAPGLVGSAANPEGGGLLPRGLFLAWVKESLAPNDTRRTSSTLALSASRAGTISFSFSLSSSATISCPARLMYWDQAARSSGSAPTRLSKLYIRLRS